MAPCSKKKRKLRLDEIIIRQCPSLSKTKARALILAGKVRQGTETLDKPGKLFAEDIVLEIAEGPRFVSRGGEKLEGFLKEYPLEVMGKSALDIGASTGGFTDCLLQRGVSTVTCVDVGRGQLHHKIRNDQRVYWLEKTNARYLEKGHLLYEDYDIIVMDVSFISLEKILPPVWLFLKQNGILIALVKPQFEVDKKTADKAQGVIRDPVIRQSTLERICAFARLHLKNSYALAVKESALCGADGNIEFFLALEKRAFIPSPLSNNEHKPICKED